MANLHLSACACLIALCPAMGTAAPRGPASKERCDTFPLQLHALHARTSFLRLEENAALRFSVENRTDKRIDKATVSISLAGIAEQRYNLPDIEGGKSHVLEYSLHTDLRPDSYNVHVDVTVPASGGLTCHERFPIWIVARSRPHRLPVVMWGVYRPSEVDKDMERLKRIGFTHVLGLSAQYQKIWNAGKVTPPSWPDGVRATRAMLNKALVHDLAIIANLSPGRYARAPPAWS